MRYLKKFNESESTSIFEVDWSKFLPETLTIITENGEFEVERKPGLSPGTNHSIDVANLMNCIQITYAHNTVDSEGGDVLADGEPDQLEFDVTIVKDNDGAHANPADKLRLNVELTYGDAMVYHFTIDYPNKVEVIHYTGKGSLYDGETYFGFSDESLQNIVNFFNSFGFETSPKDYTFMDKDLDSFEYEAPIEKGTDLKMMIMDDDEKEEVDAIQGGNKIVTYKEFFNTTKYSK
jgi:hypothetical protein